MSISLLTLRLELLSAVPDLKYFKAYTASTSHRSNSELKSYASVVKGHVEETKSEEVQKSDKRERSLSGRDCDRVSTFAFENKQARSESPVAKEEFHRKQVDNSDCRGRRAYKDIYIELIDEEAFQALLQETQQGKLAIKMNDQEASTSRVFEEKDCFEDHELEGFHVVARHRVSKFKSDDRPVGLSAHHGATQRPKSHSPTNKMSTTVNFFSGNPSVELTKGILHIYKDRQLTSMDKEVARSEMLCMMGVPASYTIHDLIMFIAPMGDCVSYMQVLRDAFPNQYMLLIKFRDQASTDEFYSYFNNRLFNSIESHICCLVYVAKIEIMTESEGGSLPIMNLTELPNCPVCLERMEESDDGILTVLCNHAFHTHCLAQWGDTSCPVCRYCQTPEEVADQRCMQCGSQESLWICLICGHVGCGRYVGTHAKKHFKDTNHTYAMQLGTNRVWDYAGDNYVHRLAQNKSDGKLVELDEGGNEFQEEKLDSLSLEYSYLLSTQLESQRIYFTEQIQAAVKDVELKLKEATEKLELERNEREKSEIKLSEITKEKQVLDKKYNQLQSRTAKVLSELQDERQMNSSLRENQKSWQERVLQLEKHVNQISETKDKKPTNIDHSIAAPHRGACLVPHPLSRRPSPRPWSMIHINEASNLGGQIIGQDLRGSPRTESGCDMNLNADSSMDGNSNKLPSDLPAARRPRPEPQPPSKGKTKGSKETKRKEKDVPEVRKIRMKPAVESSSTPVDPEPPNEECLIVSLVPLKKYQDLVDFIPNCTMALSCGTFFATVDSPHKILIKRPQISFVIE